MILRALILTGGLLGAGLSSQFPEFSQQYAQRLGGAVDALGAVVQDFDSSARASGLSRQQALEQMTGTAFVARRRADMDRVFARHANLSADLAALQGAGPFMRAYHVTRLNDPEIAGRTWQAFEPAIPMNVAGAVFAGAGLLLGMVAVSALLAILRLPVLILRRAGGLMT